MWLQIRCFVDKGKPGCPSVASGASGMTFLIGNASQQAL
jgi:hypothetical protein